MSLQTIVLVGRMNVGKSTLFNRLTEKQEALVSRIPGTTRDRRYGEVDWRQQSFLLIDTGGVEQLSGKINNEQSTSKDFLHEIKEQVEVALQEADLILFLVDGKEGLMPQDTVLVRELKKINKPIVLVVNKIRGTNSPAKTAPFWKLGLGEPYPITALSGQGTGDLLDVVVKQLPKKRAKKTKEPVEQTPIRIALMGKPNVGKSSLFNALLGEDRVIVSPLPGTTREVQDTLITYNDTPLLFLDTVGLRRKKTSADVLERKGSSITVAMLTNADIALFVIDATEMLTVQDSRIIALLLEKGTSVCIVVNKWDIVADKTQKLAQEFREKLNRRLPYATWIPVLFVSAKTHQRVKTLLPLILNLSQERMREITPNALDKFLKSSIKKQKPQRGKGTNHPYIHRFEQVKINPPTFRVTIGAKQDLNASYLKFLEKQLRDKFGFDGTPIHMRLEKRSVNKESTQPKVHKI